MNILVIGANGRTGRHILPLLKEAGHDVFSLIRDENQRAFMESLGAKVILGDLESPLDHALKGKEAVIFAAGSGSKTGPEKTVDVDQNAAISLMAQCEDSECKRFVMLSSMGVDYPEDGPEKLRHYLRAKAEADQKLKASNLGWSIVRPGLLSDDSSCGKIEANESLGPIDLSRSISREDVAKVLVGCLTYNNTTHKTFDILSGSEYIEAVLQRI